MPNFTEEQIRAALKAKSEHLGPDDVRRIANNRQAVMKMVDEFPESWAKAKEQATLLFNLIEACATGKLNIHPEELRPAAGALIYLGAPLDIVPDDEEDGYSDDAAVVGLAIAQIEKHVRSYCDSAGLSVDDYI